MSSLVKNFLKKFKVQKLGAQTLTREIFQISKVFSNFTKKEKSSAVVTSLKRKIERFADITKEFFLVKSRKY